MSVLERSELEASPLADLHEIAREAGIDGFRRMRKADLIDAILGEKAPAASKPKDAKEPKEAKEPKAKAAPAARRKKEERDVDEDEERPARRRRQRRGGRDEEAGERREEKDETVEGVVEVLGNGSAFLRVDGPEPSDADVYVSAAQVRRCELVSGDKVSGPVRKPRRSERYPSLVRVDTINGTPADEVSDGVRYEDLPVAWPKERIELGAKGDSTLEAIELLTPLGRGSRALIFGPRQSGKSETLMRLAAAARKLEGVEVLLALIGVRPEEIADYTEAGVEPAVTLAFATSAEAQTQALERLLDGARRSAARGADVIVLIDTLDALSSSAARRALAAARNLRDAGSLTVIATASEPLGGETTLIALEESPAGGSGQPIVDLARSGTLRVELIVGESSAKEIAKARSKAARSR